MHQAHAEAACSCFARRGGSKRMHHRSLLSHHRSSSPPIQLPFRSRPSVNTSPNCPCPVLKKSCVGVGPRPPPGYLWSGVGRRGFEPPSPPFPNYSAPPSCYFRRHPVRSPDTNAGSRFTYPTGTATWGGDKSHLREQSVCGVKCKPRGPFDNEAKLSQPATHQSPHRRWPHALAWDLP